MPRVVLTARSPHGGTDDGGKSKVEAPRRRVPTRLLVAAIVGAWYLLLGIAWVVADPVPAGIDEPAHYIKALATGQGQLTGEHAPAPNDLTGLPDVKYVEDQASRAFMVPARLTSDGVYSCNAESDRAATCTAGSRCMRYAAPCPDSQLDRDGLVREVSYNGEYEPTMYVLPGLLSRLASDDQGGMRMARFGGLLVATLAIALAAAVLYEVRAPAFALLGLLVAVSPMVVHLTSVVNPNGGEIALAICFFAALLRIGRDGARTQWWVWAVAGVSGGLLGCSRATGTVWVVLDIVTVVALLGVRPSLRLFRDSGRRAWLAGAAVASGLILDAAWWRVIEGQPHSRLSLVSARDYVFASFDGLTRWLQEEIGVFGWLDVGLNGSVYAIWSVMVVALLGLALLVGTRRQRMVLGTLVCVDVFGTVVLASITRVEFGYPGGGMEGRYMLPVSAAVVLLAGEIVLFNHRRLGALIPHRLVIYLGAAAAFSQACAFWINARHYAVGPDGPLLFVRRSLWQPPFGWLPWLGLAGAGCGLIFTLAVLVHRTSGIGTPPDEKSALPSYVPNVTAATIVRAPMPRAAETAHY